MLDYVLRLENVLKLTIESRKLVALTLSREIKGRRDEKIKNKN